MLTFLQEFQNKYRNQPQIELCIIFDIMTFIKGFASGAFTSLACFYIYDSTTKHNKKELSPEQDLNAVKISADNTMLEDINQVENGRRILKYGIPDRGRNVYAYQNHMLAYDQSKKIPIWVAEHITTDNVKGKANRKHSHFKPDPSIDNRFTAQNEDYRKSGWSRGHMTPAGNHKYDQSAMNDSFYLSNIVPQNLDNNAGFWNRFELYCRDLTKKFKDVRVITGPVFLPNLEEDGPPFIKYPLIGKSQVAVPTHLYKVIVAESNDKKQPIALGAFIVPNKPIGYGKVLTDFIIPLETLEEKTGLIFLPKLDQTKTKHLCSVDLCNLQSRDEFELYFIGRRMESANNIEQLNKVYNEIKTKHLKSTEAIKNLYYTKELELKGKELEKEMKSKKEL